MTMMLYTYLLSQQQMRNQTQIQFEKNQLYHQYFQKCSDLALIARPFFISSISEEINTRDLESQFELLRALTQTKKHKLKLRVNSIMENKKNRYPQQSIYEHSRVKIEEMSEQAYINANWIPLPQDRRLIITQGPLQHTQDHFEEMILQNQIECVVMLCNIIENGKVRCYDYTANREREDGQQGAVSISQVFIPNGRYVHVHYSEWPDRSVPENNQEVGQLLDELMKYKRVVIHCSAGLGRSGVIAALLSICLVLESSEEVSVFGTALRIRQHRFGAIQNSEQYAYIYRFLKHRYC